MFQLITSANVACGLHAGDPVTMLDSCRAAFELDVTVGAHIGYRDLAGYGQRALGMSFDELFGEPINAQRVAIGLPWVAAVTHQVRTAA